MSFGIAFIPFKGKGFRKLQERTNLGGTREVKLGNFNTLTCQRCMHLLDTLVPTVCVDLKTAF